MIVFRIARTKQAPAEINDREGVTIDACGNLYVADETNKRIRKVTFNPTCSLASLNTNEINNIHEISIFPNPANDLLQINNLKTPSTYQLTSIIDSILQHGTIQQGINPISIRSLPSGMYLLELVDEQGNKTVKKIIKQ